MTLRTRVLVIVGWGLAAFAVGMVIVWVRSQPERKFDKQAYLEEMAFRGKSLDKKPASEKDAGQTAGQAPGAARQSPSPDAAPQQLQIPESEQPRILVESDTFDCGVVSNKEPTTKEMLIRNVGSGTLEIRQLASSCGCAKAELAEDQRFVPPGGQAIAKITVDPKRIHGFDSTKLVSIISNDPDNHILKIKVHAKVEPEFAVEPEVLDFGTIEKGTRKEMTMMVRQIGTEPIEVTGLESRSQMNELALSFEKAPEDKWVTPGKPEYLVRVAFDTEPASQGDYRGEFLLNTTCKRVPRLQCVVKAHIESFFTVQPKTMPIFTAKTDSNGAAAVKVVGTTPITVEDANVSGGEMTAKVIAGENPNTVLIQILVDDTVKPGRKEERLSFVVKSGDKMARHSLRVYGNLVDRTARQRMHDVKKRRSGDRAGVAAETPQLAPAAASGAAPK